MRPARKWRPDLAELSVSAVEGIICRASPVMHVPTVYVLKNFSAQVLTSIFNNRFLMAPKGNAEFYERAAQCVSGLSPRPESDEPRVGGISLCHLCDACGSRRSKSCVNIRLWPQMAGLGRCADPGSDNEG